MNFSAFFIRRPVATILFMATILFFGYLSYLTLPVSDLPSVDFPTIQVNTTYPGANPETMANNVTSVLEQEFLGIDGIQTITSSSKTGSATIVLQFVLEKSIDAAAQDVQAAINAASAQLPENLPYSPTYEKVNPSATPILFMALHSATMPYSELYNYAKNTISQHISTVNGVAYTYIYGSPYAVRVQVDPQKLAAKGIGLDEVAAAIKSQNVYNPVGVLYGSTREMNINIDGQISKADGYNSLIIKNKDGAIVRLQDIGQAIDSTRTDKFYIKYLTPEVNEPCVVVGVQKRAGTNTLEIIQNINNILPELQKALPGSVKLSKVLDLSVFVKESVHEVQFTLIIAILLVIVVIFIYLGKLLNTIIPALAIPLSIMGTFIVLFCLGFSLDILSLLAITLAVGFLVDDAIVVIENIARYVEAGQNSLEASLQGSKEICKTIISMTICLAAVFIPFLFMKGIIGRLFFEFSITIISAVLISGLVSLSLTPMLCATLIKPYRSIEQRGKIERFSVFLNQKLVQFYKKTLLWAFSNKALILCFGGTCLVLSIVLFKFLPRDFLPENNIGAIQGFSVAADSTSPFQMIKYQQQVDRLIKENPYYDNIVSIAASYATDNQGSFFMHLKPSGQRPKIRKIIQDLMPKLSSIPGIRIFMKPLPLIDLEVGTSSSKGDYQYTLQSLNAEELYRYAPVMLQRMKKLPGFTQIYSDLELELSQLNMHILRDRASMLDVSASAIEDALGFAFATGNLSPINEPDNQFYVIMEVLPKFYSDPSMLSQLYVKSTKGKLVPLNQVVEMKESIGPLNINHINAFPAVTISFNLEKQSLSQGLDALQKLAGEVLPPSIQGQVQGSANVFLESFSNLSFLLIITLFIIYVILGILYENFLQPLTVMSTLPPAACGGLLSLWIFREALSLYSFLGIVMLLGIVLKNGIIMIEFANQRVRIERRSCEDAIMDACLIRFRPILMTTISALTGAVPIALGIGGTMAQGRVSLGIAIIGGLIFSQVMTLYLTPVIYLYLERLHSRISKHIHDTEYKESSVEVKDGDDI